MGRRYTRTFIVIIILLVLALWMVLGRINIGGFHREGFRLGLDLRGGTHLVYEAQFPPDLSSQERAQRLEGARRIIEGRVDAYGVTEPLIQTQGEGRLSIQLPGVRDINEALNLIGKTAQLDFREQAQKDGVTEWVPAQALGSDGKMHHLTGDYLKPNARVGFEPPANQPVVEFEFNSEGGKLFEQITSRLIEKPLGIFLDNQLISAPTVRAVIKERGIIENIPLEEARVLAIQLNAGALPVPLKIIEQEDVDATLGKDSLDKSILAGVIGLVLVFAFMVAYYRWAGLLACLALLIYALLSLAIFKMLPVTLSLAGIAAFIISIGMAVDANILIFERTKEELRAGRTLLAAIEAGFNRAWPSIRDSNVSTFITCAILYWFGNSFGETRIMGFALTLFIGVAVSMFTAITVTRTLLRLMVGSAWARGVTLFPLAGERSVAQGVKQ